MKFVIQRVNHASVEVDGKVIGSIQKGFLVFVGVYDSDTKEIADKMINKLVKMRIFADENGKTNLDISKRPTPDRFTVYLVRRLPEGQQTIIYWCRSA